MIIPIGDDNPTRRQPIVNYGLIALNIAAFLWTFTRPYFGSIVNRYGFTPADFQLGTMLTSMFLHADPLHLAFNMLYLWIVGDNVEDRVGHVPYLLFYILAGIAGASLHAMFARMAAAPILPAVPMTYHGGPVPGAAPHPAEIPSIGASGAISGVMGAYAVMFPRNRIRFWYWVYFYGGTFTMSSLWAIGIWFLLQLFGGLASGGDSVAWFAHIGGFLLGAVLITLMILTGALARRATLLDFGRRRSHW